MIVTTNECQFPEVNYQKIHERKKSRELAGQIAELARCEAETLSAGGIITYWQELSKQLGGMLLNTNCYRCNSWPCECSDGITLIAGDCLEVLKQIPAVDLLITDPPYGQAYRSKWNGLQQATKEIAGDYSLATLEAAWPQMIGKLRDDRHWYVFGSIRPDLMSRQQVHLKAKQILVWDKLRGTHGDIECSFANSAELIYFGMRGRRPLNGRPRSVVKLPASMTRRHPTEKPVDLMKMLIETSTQPGETVLDPFCGVGPTLVAAKMTGRKAIGIEVDPEYCDVAAQQLRQHSLYAHAQDRG